MAWQCIRAILARTPQTSLHTHTRCAVLARHSTAGRAQLLGLAACSSQSSESRRDGRTHASNTRVPRIFVNTHSVQHWIWLKRMEKWPVPVVISPVVTRRHHGDPPAALCCSDHIGPTFTLILSPRMCLWWLQSRGILHQIKLGGNYQFHTTL